MKRIIVAGGGAAGFMSAFHAKSPDTEVTILEAQEKPGKKLLTTGNGKCNLTYASKKPVISYRGNGQDFTEAALKTFDQERTVQFFEELGMLMHEKNGGLYPYSDQAQTVQTIFLDALRERGVKIKTRERIKSILPQKSGGFLVKTEGWQYEADAVILACGSKAAPALGGCEDGYQLAEKLDHSVTKIVPALVPLKTKEAASHALAGLRSPANVKLFIDGKKAAESEGELQWTSYGISGIVVFQVSRFAALGLLERKNVQISIDLLPQVDRWHLLAMYQKQTNRRAEHLLSGIFPQKLAAFLLKQTGQKADAILQEEPFLEMLALASDLRLTVTGTRSFDYAQVCAGGIDTAFVNAKTMESEKVPGLYFAGEILDVDGACGGYNLQWAWSSGYLAGYHAANDQKGQVKQNA